MLSAIGGPLGRFGKGRHIAGRSRACYAPGMIVRDIDWRSPIDAFAPLAEEPFAVLLHAGAQAAPPGWSMIAAFPATRLVSRSGRTSVNDEERTIGAFTALKALHAERRASGEGGGPFQTGLIGFAGYELGGEIEAHAKGPPSPFALPDLAFGAYDAAALFDRARRRAFMVGKTDSAVRRLEEALGRDGAFAPSPVRFQPPRSNFSPEEYRGAVQRAVRCIREGDFFQVNLSQQIAALSVDPCAPFDLFVRLSEGSAAPFGAYLRHEEGAVLSNSPERFFSFSAEGRRICAEPIKGTRPRGATPQEDEALARALLESAKDRAENIMIADLTRNDLSRVCEDGSIVEEEICALSSNAGVHHLVSRISGRLQPKATAVDALIRLFPCGSVTGAPKIEAMRAIAEIEGRGRGPYCGAIGYLDDRGSADFSVAIRLIVAERLGEGLRATVPVGGGVTLRSDPDTEYRETLLKARGSLAALGLTIGA
jgi:para-aminobenzoate synthetase component 1